MEQHYVEFLSPGTLVSETSRYEVEKWDIEKAKTMATGIVERHNARPYGFRFLTRARSDVDLDAKETARSGIYYLGGRVETLEQVEARGDPDEEILLLNMRLNGYDKIIINENSWRFMAPLYEQDTVLDFTMPPRPDAANH